MAITSPLPTDLIERVRAEQRLPSPAARRAIRLAAGCSQQQLADELGIDRVSICRFELGTRAPRGRLRLAYFDLLEQLQDAVASPYPKDALSPAGQPSSAETSVSALGGVAGANGQPSV